MYCKYVNPVQELNFVKNIKFICKSYITMYDYQISLKINIYFLNFKDFCSNKIFIFFHKCQFHQD